MSIPLFPYPQPQRQNYDAPLSDRAHPDLPFPRCSALSGLPFPSFPRRVLPEAPSFHDPLPPKRLIRKTPQRDRSKPSEPLVCVICLENLDSTSNLALTTCKHSFHLKCWNQYVLKFAVSTACTVYGNSLSCPSCRTVQS